MGAHYSYRDARNLYGVFGAVGGIGSNDNCCEGGDGFGHATFGVEAQHCMGNITLYGQAGFQTSVTEPDEGGYYHGMFLRGVGRYFVDDNLKAEAFLAYANARASSALGFRPVLLIGAQNPSHTDMQQVSWGIGVEKRFDGRHFSGFARYEGSWTEFKSDFDAGYGCSVCQYSRGHTTEHMFKAGFRVYLNENTLKYNDRNGATLDIRDPFTSAYRAFGRTWHQVSGDR